MGIKVQTFAFAVPPEVEFRLEQDTTVLKEGTSMTLSCSSSGFPMPTVSIFKVCSTHNRLDCQSRESAYF